MPAAAVRTFRRTLERVDFMIAVHTDLHVCRGRPIQFFSDVLRGALVLGVAALDALVADSVAAAERT